MIWIFLLLNFLWMNLKLDLFLNFIFSLNLMNIFMILISIVFLIFLSNMNFNYNSNENNKNLNFMMYSVLIFSNLTFMSTKILIMMTAMEASMFPLLKIFLKQAKDKDKISSMTFMFIMNMAGSFIMLMYACKLELFTKTNLNFMNFANYYFTEISMFIMFTLMLLSKIPMMFLQFWLSKAHVSASGPCSMVLASVMLKLGGYGMMKFFKMTMSTNKILSNFMLSLNIFSFMMVTLIMIRFMDMKVVVALSSIMHMALTIPMVMLYENMSIMSSLIIFVSHGLISCLFFYLISLIYEVSINRSMELNKNLESVNKTFSFLMSVTVFLNLGIPPLINLISEMMQLSKIVKISSYSSVILMLTMILMIMFCMMMILSLNFGKKNFMMKKNPNLMNFFTSGMCISILIFTPMFLI